MLLSCLPSSVLLLIFLNVSNKASATTTNLLVPRATQQASIEYTDNDDFKNAALNSTNTYRAQHNATAVSWNQSLADYAGKYSGKCVFQHSGGPSGENLAAGYSNTTAAHEAWGNERDQYNFDDPGFSEATGHFTQLVWKSTTTIGCGRTECDCDGKTCKAYGWYVVCEYFPPGNVIGEFAQNVQARIPASEEPTSTSGSTATKTATATKTGSASPKGTSGNCPYPGQKCSAADRRFEMKWHAVTAWLVWVTIMIMLFGP